MNNCRDCDSTGLVDAINLEETGRYVFKCKCISGGRRSEALPLWGSPTRGFRVFNPETREKRPPPPPTPKGISPREKFSHQPFQGLAGSLRVVPPLRAEEELPL